MPAGDAFTPDQLYDIERAVRHAETVSGLRFSVYVGGADSETRPFAIELLNELPDPDRSVLVFVDPAGRRLEIVTGPLARRQLSDTEAGLAALAMQTSFATGDLTGGLVTGIQQLGAHAHQAPMLHANEPHQQ
ncbi:uncharacterized protein DUF5130 [Kribbella voronezhensis]|uniref:Uncharacterized protein DUF5130 n=1 Tax=Kribbella voronezhensis TaxID=2512212 RepID=A0A4R7T927_9ACTN|nr:DUF5130 family protein [Kribbella voronezhensis]TDU87718.1 uncharacterized protein DUF5130 [Kribbella voronezhensis]